MAAKAGKNYVARTETLIKPILDEHDFELVDLEWVKEGPERYLRAYIDKEGGITIDDCELVSRALSDLLDKEDFISENYILEVSSPGLDRPLKKDRDFERSIGKDVEVRLFRQLNGQKEYTGTLKAFDSEKIIIALEDGADIGISRSDIALVRLAFTF